LIENIRRRFWPVENQKSDPVFSDFSFDMFGHGGHLS
jgi:hypothetical protein